MGWTLQNKRLLLNANCKHANMHVNENLIGHFNVKTYSIDYVTVVLSVLLINTEVLECEHIFLICEKGRVRISHILPPWQVGR